MLTNSNFIYYFVQNNGLSMRTLKYVIICAGIGMASACGETTDEKNKVDESLVENVENNSESEDFDFVLPQFMTLAKSFQAAGLKYAPGKTNATDNKDKYTTKLMKLLNMGVYSTDLAYCSLNGKTQEARNYLKVVQEMGVDVGLGSVFSDEQLIKKFDQNISNQEAIEEFVYEVQDKSETYLQDNDLRYMSVIQFAGAWIEGMYLGAENSSLKQGDELASALADQMILLKNIIRGLETYPKSDVDLKGIVAKFKAIEATYAGFESVKKAGNNPNLKAPELSAADIQKLSKAVAETRTFIVTGN
jgi:hypothetical protein